MSKETDSFLNNECMQAIIELANKYPNDMDFGRHTRAFILDQQSDPNQIKFEFPHIDIDDERSFLGRKRDDE